MRSGLHGRRCSSWAWPARAVGRGAGGSRAPNILLIVADDLGWSDVGWHGGFSKTPRMDALVREGIEPDQHYVQPVCTPTRTAACHEQGVTRGGSVRRRWPQQPAGDAARNRDAGLGSQVARVRHLSGGQMASRRTAGVGAERLRLRPRLRHADWGGGPLDAQVPGGSSL